MKENLELIIAGATNKSAITLDLINPFSQELIATIIKPTADEIEKAFMNAENAFNQKMKKMPAYRRAEILHKLASLINENSEELALQIATEGGKPLKDARIETARAVNTVKFSADEALRINGEQITMDRAPNSQNHISFTIKEPIGPVLAISAFNHPVNLICHQVATSIAAGNSIIVKPSEKTPLSCYQICSYILQSGFPEEALSVLPLTGIETEKIISDRRLRFVSFIGNATVGWKIPKLIANGVGYSLEHGGTASAIVDKNCDLNYAADSIIKGGFYHAGQVCVSTQNVFIHQDVYDIFVKLMIEKTGKIVTGNPQDENTDVGPIITSQKVEDILAQINQAVNLGAKKLIGGNYLGNNCIEPTLLSNTNYGMRIMNSEIFGPVININKYINIQNVIEECNATPFAFQNAIYTNDINLALTFSRNINSKAVIINDSTAFRVDWMPFGGSDYSGFGVSGVKYSINDLVKDKLIVIKHLI